MAVAQTNNKQMPVGQTLKWGNPTGRDTSKTQIKNRPNPNSGK